MKNPFFIFLFCFLLLKISTKAQSLSNEVISTSGNYSTASWGTLSETVGEAVTTTITGGGYFLTQGFQQPITTSNGINSNTSLDFEINFFPNPTSAFANLNLTSKVNGTAHFKIYDVSGKEVYSSIPSTILSGIRDEQKIDLSSLALACTCFQ